MNLAMLSERIKAQRNIHICMLAALSGSKTGKMELYCLFRNICISSKTVKNRQDIIFIEVRIVITS